MQFGRKSRNVFHAVVIGVQRRGGMITNSEYILISDLWFKQYVWIVLNLLLDFHNLIWLHTGVTIH